MEEKYLPIGTVCTLKNNNKKIMIISYFSIEYNGNVKMYDYKGCVYPEGLLLPSQAVSFDHTDIENIDFIGYKNEQFDIFNNSLNREEKEEEENYEQKPFMSNFKFDENGVVVFDGTQPTETEPASVAEKLPVFNPFKQEYQNEDTTKPNNQNNIFKFDENGVVISDGTIDTPQTTEKPKFQFDENGFVISDGTSTNEPALAGNSGFQFDENGVVISDGTENAPVLEPVEEIKPETTGIKFDENGIVISE